MKTSLALVSLALLAALTGGCGGDARQSAAAKASGPACPKAWRVGWQRLANRIDAPVYCPSWVPSPLTAELEGEWNTVNSVDPDRSYLVGFAWQERSEEVHVNFRGYPGRTRVPTCLDVQTGAGKVRRRPVPCFSDARGVKRAGGVVATVYTVNRDADMWHVLYAWRRQGTLYTLSEHIAPPLTYARVVQNLDRMLRGLVLLEPRS